MFQQILCETVFTLLLGTHRIFNQNVMCCLFDLLAFIDASLPHSYYFPNKFCLGFVFQAQMENPKLCHDKSKHLHAENVLFSIALLPKSGGEKRLTQAECRGCSRSGR